MKRTLKGTLSIIFLAAMIVSVFAGSYDTAVDLYNQGVDLHDSNPNAALQKYLKSLEYDKTIGEVYLNIGLIYINQNNLDKGEEYTIKAMETFLSTNKKISDSQTFERLVAICNNNIGVIYLRRMDNTSNKAQKQKYLEYSLTDFLWALEIDPSYDTALNNYNSNLPYIEKSATEFYNDGVDFLDAKKNIEAVVRFKIAMDLDKSIGEAYLNCGLAYLREKEYNLCETYSKEALNTFRKYKKTIAEGQTIEQLQAICYLNMGLAYIGKAQEAHDKGNINDAKIYHNTAKEMWKKGAEIDPTYPNIQRALETYRDSYL
ncbi:MAG: hypothetical protein PHV06_09415 [bacterium]|nr:hypothetical protein [bacterium]